MFKIILGFLGWVLKPITAVLDLIPGLPPELVDILHTVLGYMRQGMGIINFFCPLNLIAPAITVFVAGYAVRHGYDTVMWVLRKIPIIGIK